MPGRADWIGRGSLSVYPQKGHARDFSPDRIYFPGFEPLLDVILWCILGNNANANYDTLNYTYAYITGPALFLGILIIVLAFFLGFWEAKLPPPQMGPLTCRQPYDIG
jgi:hypothetical protein